MDHTSPNEVAANGTNGAGVGTRIQIPGLHVDDALVDGEILIQWTPASSNSRPITSTVFVVAGPNAHRPGLKANDGLPTNPDAHALTEAQAEAFVPTAKHLPGRVERSAVIGRQTPAKQLKKPVLKRGRRDKRRKSVAFAPAGEVAAPRSTESPPKRSKTLSAAIENGVESTVVLSLNDNTIPPLTYDGGIIGTKMAPVNSTKATVATNGETNAETNGAIEEFMEELVDKSEEKVAKAHTEVPITPKKTPRKTSTKNSIKATKASQKEPTQDSAQEGVMDLELVIDKMGRKRLRNSSGHFISVPKGPYVIKKETNYEGPVKDAM